MTTRKAAIGDRVYWEGDMANEPKNGTVVSVGFHIEIRWDDDTTSHVSKHTFDGPRWGFIDDRERRRAEMLADFEKQFGRRAGCSLGVK